MNASSQLTAPMRKRAAAHARHREKNGPAATLSNTASIPPCRASQLPRNLAALARQIAGHAEGSLQMAVALDAAEAQLELARVQRVGVALVERIAAFGRLEQRKLFRSIRDDAASMALTCLGARLGNIQPKCAIDTLPPMPADEPQRTAVAASCPNSSASPATSAVPQRGETGRFAASRKARIKFRDGCRLLSSNFAKRTQILFAIRET